MGFFMSCICYAFVRVCLFVPCGHLLRQGGSLGSRLWCITLSFHFAICTLGQVWYLIVSIPDLCTLTYFKHVHFPIILSVFPYYSRILPFPLFSLIILSLNLGKGLVKTLCLIVWSADNLCKQFGPRSCPDKTSGLNLLLNRFNSDDIPEIIFRKS